VILGQLVLQDRQVHKVSRDPQAHKERLDLQVNKVSKVSREKLVLKEKWEQLVLKEIQVQQDLQVFKERLASQDLQDPKESRVIRVSREQRDHKVNRVSRERLEPQGLPVLLDLRVHREKLVQQDPLELKAYRVKLEKTHFGILLVLGQTELTMLQEMWLSLRGLLIMPPLEFFHHIPHQITDGFWYPLRVILGLQVLKAKQDLLVLRVLKVKGEKLD
jgi:hypothetical protein